VIDTQIEVAAGVGLAGEEEMQLLQGKVGAASNMYGLIRLPEKKSNA